MSDPVRLDKQLTLLTGCSRADAQQYIEGGWVTVDGRTVEASQTRVTDEVIVLDPEARLDAIEPATMLLHKPAGATSDAAIGLVRPATHAQGDLSGVRLLQRHFHKLHPLMPLEPDASGLLVVTQDARVAHRLTEDRGSIEQEFLVETSGIPGEQCLERLARGLRFEGRALPPCKVSWQNETRLRFAIKGVQPGQLRHMCREVGLDVVAIRRLRIGRISLGKMPIGEWRYQPVHERF
jgi:23S rRNA pseudouridine2604 synthase